MAQWHEDRKANLCEISEAAKIAKGIQRFECTWFCRNLCCCGFLNFSSGSEERLSVEECVLDLSVATLFSGLFGTCLGLKGGMKALCLNVWTLQILLDPYRIWK